jgi:hypothetical protein
MPSLEQRVADLEQSLVDGKDAEPCFWCACEGGESAEACMHRDWKPIAHETALAELA